MPSPRVGSRNVAIFAVGGALWVAAVHFLAAPIFVFAAAPRGFAFLVAVVAHGLVETAGLRVTPTTFGELEPGALLFPLGLAGSVQALVAWPPSAGAATAVATGLGVLVYGLGVGLRAWAQATLGEAFTAHVDPDTDQGLVTAGPYRLVRHPSYLALTMVLVAFPLLLGSLVGGLLSLVGFAPFVWSRVRLEEARLREAFGDEYEAYAREVPALVPRP